MAEWTVQNVKLENYTNEQLLELYKKNNELELKQELALRYLYIVRSIAIQMRDVYVGFTQVDDIVHEGVIVLMSAIDKFDVDKNVKFETYIAKRIRGMVIDIARKQDWVPRTVRKNARDIAEASMELYKQTGRTATDAEVATHLNMDINRFQSVIGKSNLFSVLSLDIIFEESSERNKSAKMPSALESDQPEQHYLENEFKEILKSGIMSLKENEQLVISLYYIEELNMKKIASVLEVSEPRVSQIHANAIRKLKEYIEIATTSESKVNQKGRDKHVSGIL